MRRGTLLHEHADVSGDAHVEPSLYGHNGPNHDRWPVRVGQDRRIIGGSPRRSHMVTRTHILALLIALVLRGSAVALLGTTDGATFTDGTTPFLGPTGGEFNDSATTVSSGKAGVCRITSKRALHVNLRDNSGSESGVAANPLQCSLANTAANATPVTVNGTVTANAGSGTFTVGGTVTANAGTNLNTSALALDATVGRVQASTTSGQTGPLVQGAVTTSAPSYTNAQTDPLSLTTGGLLRVDGSGVTQPVSGTVTSTPSGTQDVNVKQVNGTTQTGRDWSPDFAKLQNIPSSPATDRTTAGGPFSTELSDGTAFYTAAKTGQLPTALDGSGFLKIHEQGTATVSGTVTANAGTGTFTVADGADVTVGTGVNGTSAQTGWSDGTNVRVPRVYDTDTGAGTEYTAGATIRGPASGGSTAVNVIAATNALKADLSSVAGTATATAAAGIPKVGVTDGSGTAITSTGAALDVNVKTNAATNQSVNVAQINGTTPLMDNGASGTGAQRVTIANNSTGTVEPWDGTNKGTFKAASTAPVLADTAQVVAVSPNNTGLPVVLPTIVQQTGNVTASGTTATATLTPTAGNTLIGLCGVNNTGTIVISDNSSNVWRNISSQTGTTAGVAIGVATGAVASATTFTCTAGSSGVVGITIYDVSGLVAVDGGVSDSLFSGSGTATSTNFSTQSTATLVNRHPNELVITAGMLTANNVVTNTGGASGWVVDTQQGATGGRLIPVRRQLTQVSGIVTGTVIGTMTSSSYAIVEAAFHSVTLPIQGQVELNDPQTGTIGGVGGALKTDMTSIAGTATLADNGASGAGAQRVTVANNSTGTMEPWDGTTKATFKAASTPAATTDTAQVVAFNPLASPVCTTTKAISQASSAVQKIISGSSGKRIYICALTIVVGGTAEVVNIYEGTKTTNECDTNQVVLYGSSTAANGMAFAANGGFAQTSSTPFMKTQTDTNDLCIATSGANRIAGSISYVLQ